MAADPTVVGTITDGLSDAKGDLLGVAAVGLGIGASILVLRKGWGLVKRFF